MAGRTIPVRLLPDEDVPLTNQGGYVPPGAIPSNQAGGGFIPPGDFTSNQPQFGGFVPPSSSQFQPPAQIGQPQFPPIQQTGQFGGFVPPSSSQFQPPAQIGQFGGFVPPPAQQQTVRPPVLIESITNNQNRISDLPVRNTRIVTETTNVPVKSLGRVNYDRNFEPPEQLTAPQENVSPPVPSSEAEESEISTPSQISGTNIPSARVSETRTQVIESVKQPIQILPIAEHVQTTPAPGSQIFVSQKLAPPLVQQQVIETRSVRLGESTCNIHTESTCDIQPRLQHQVVESRPAVVEEITEGDLEREIELEKEEEEIEEEIEKEQYDNFWRNPAGYPLILLIFGVIIIIIVNMIFIARAPATDKNGNPVNSDLKWSAMIMATAITIILAVIFAGFLYYANKATLISYQWLVFLLTVVFLLLIAVFTAYIAGWWMGIGFLWAPTSAPPKTTQ